jgi:DNA (cytosine-5)-methyltransferase 1
VHVDLFAGAGGFGLGVTQAGFHTIAANEFDEWATITYLVNLGANPCKIIPIEDGDEERLEKALKKQNKMWHDRQRSLPVGDQDKTPSDVEVPTVSGSGWIAAHPELVGCQVFFFGDCRKLTGQMIFDATGFGPGEIDLVTGGPPCQGFSVSGKRNVYDERNSLTLEFVRLVIELQPKTFAMENVPGILSMVFPDGTPVIDEIVMRLEAGGMGRADALRQMLETTSGVGVAKKLSRHSEMKRGSKAGAVGQQTLFGGPSHVDEGDEEEDVDVGGFEEPSLFEAGPAVDLEGDS